MPPTSKRAWALGHVTQDRIVVPGREDRTQFGGSAYYVARAWASLGWSSGIVTRMAEADATALRAELAPMGIEVSNHESPTTTIFENRYEGAALARRTQRVMAVAAPFEVGHVSGLDARVLHLGPLTKDEVPPDVIAAAVERYSWVSLDAQGDLRRVEDGAVVPAVVRNLDARLRRIRVLKVDDLEAARLTGLDDSIAAGRRLLELGAGEVLVTLADRGALILTEGRVHHARSVPPAAHVDATGCGDTYVAAYVHARFEGASAIRAARFAASAASLKLEGYGPLRANAEHVRRNVR